MYGSVNDVDGSSPGNTTEKSAPRREHAGDGVWNNICGARYELPRDSMPNRKPPGWVIDRNQCWWRLPIYAWQPGRQELCRVATI